MLLAMAKPPSVPFKHMQRKMFLVSNPSSKLQILQHKSVNQGVLVLSNFFVFYPSTQIWFNSV